MPVAGGLYYETHGPVDASPLILSAGLGGSGSYWAPNLPALASRHRVILYDHRGTGRSDRSLPAIVSVDDFADDMLTVLDACGAERATVIGHAAGGVAGLALALKTPGRLDKLVVVNGWAKADPHFLRCFETRLSLLRDSGPKAFVRAQPLFLYPANWISENIARLDTEAAQQLAHFPGRDTYEKRVAALAAFDIADRLGDIATPTLVLSAADDMLVPSLGSTKLAAGLPAATHVTMAFGGHACNIVDPDGFDRLVLDFVGS